MSATEQTTALRALADLVEAHPELAADIEHALGSALLAMPLHNPEVTDERERLALWARAARRHGAATVTKGAQDDTFELDISWPGLTIKVLAHRDQVCERVVTGTETVTKLVPDLDAPPRPMVEVTETVERVEWRCGPLLADDAAESQS
jgi:hypothetical protein